MGLRLVDAGSESCRYILTQMGAGHSIALVPGGAAEMLDSCLGDYILTLNRRKQFVKMALETGYYNAHHAFPSVLFHNYFIYPDELIYSFNLLELRNHIGHRNMYLSLYGLMFWF